MFFALLVVVGTILAIGFQNIAAATPEQVNFNPVTIRNGAKIHVNGDKTLTAIDNGNKLVADNTNGTAVKGDQIESELNSFAVNNYGEDALFKSSVVNNPSSLSETELNAFWQYLPTVDGDYWLSDIGSKGSLTWQSYATANNSLAYNTLKATGKIDGVEYEDTQITVGSYAYNKDIKLENYDYFAGYEFKPYNNLYDKSNYIRLGSWFTNKKVLETGQTVFNNPYMKARGSSSTGFSYTYTSVKEEKLGYLAKTFCGYVIDGRIQRVTPGQEIPKGAILAYAFWEVSDILSNTDGFCKSASFYNYQDPYIYGYNTYLGFFYSQSSFKVGDENSFGGVYGVFGKWREQAGTTIADSIASDSKTVRPSFYIDNSKIAFIGSAGEGGKLNTSSTFGDAPSSSASNNEDKKLVIKSADTTITNSLADSKLSTDKSANNHATTKYTNGVIQVPYGAKTLTIDSSAFSISNANYISALANVNGTQKYAVLGLTGENLEIDLASIVNNNQVASKAAVSFYAEKANASNTSDVISETPVTVEIEVVEGSEQTIRYDLGGGSGTLPSNATVKAGKSYTMADGSGLNKDGNPFSRWELTYTPYGETDEVSRLVKANEAIVVPDAANGTITATAMYSGFSSMKSTDSKSSVVTVTWDSNAPSGTTATFTDSTGTYNDDKSIRYDKIKIAGSSVAVPGAPTLSVATKFFDGWYDAKEGGNKVTGSDNPSVNTTYYAHWLDVYKVTYDASGGTGASQAGKFSDNTTEDSELVQPGASTVGPSKGIPVVDDPNYMFYGWYNSPNGADGEFDETGTKFDDLGCSKTVYAYYDLAYTFLAPATSTVTANPRTISGSKYTIARVHSEARDIATKGSSSQYYSKYNDWMNNDSYHLYTLLNRKDASLADSWVEFRIVNVGQLDSDGTGLTFQAVHMLQTAYYMNSDDNLSCVWASCALRPKMQAGGEIYSMFDTQLTSRVYNVTRNSKGRLWIPSWYELSGTYYPTVSSIDGSQFAYWKGKAINRDDPNSCLAIAGTRSGSKVESTTYSGFWWMRASDKVSISECYLYVSKSGALGFTYLEWFRLGVTPCFSL